MMYPPFSLMRFDFESIIVQMMILGRDEEKLPHVENSWLDFCLNGGRSRTDTYPRFGGSGEEKGIMICVDFVVFNVFWLSGQSGRHQLVSLVNDVKVKTGKPEPGLADTGSSGSAGTGG